MSNESLKPFPTPAVLGELEHVNRELDFVKMLRVRMIISKETRPDFERFTAFRHFIRHAYSYEINPAMIKKILKCMSSFGGILRPTGKKAAGLKAPGRKFNPPRPRAAVTQQLRNSERARPAAEAAARSSSMNLPPALRRSFAPGIRY